MNNFKYILPVLMLLIPSTVYGAKNKCEIISQKLIQDKKATITIKGNISDKSILTVTYSPETRVEKIVNIPLNGTNTATLSPERAGLVKLSIKNGKQTICSKMDSIHFNGFPLRGFIIFSSAALFLFGGTFISLKKAFKHDMAANGENPEE